MFLYFMNMFATDLKYWCFIAIPLAKTGWNKAPGQIMNLYCQQGKASETNTLAVLKCEVLR